MTLQRVWVVTAIASTFASWLLLLAVMVDSSTIPLKDKPHTLLRMVLYTLPIPINLSTLYVLELW